MKMIIHIIKKDASFLRIVWIFWVLLVAAQVGLAAKVEGLQASSAASYVCLIGGLAVGVAGISILKHVFRSSSATGVALDLLRICLGAVLVATAIGLVRVPTGLPRFEILRLYFNAMGAAWMGVAYLLSAIVILQDSPVGTKMFWATRPVSGGRLLASKILALFLFLVVTPALVWLPWRIHSGFSAFDLLIESGVTMIWASAAVAPAIVLATLAGTGPRFMLYNVVGIVAVITLGMVLAARSALSGHELTGINLGWPSLLTALLAAAAVITQYRTRRWFLSMGQFLLGIALGLIVGACAPAGASVRLRGPSTPVPFASDVDVVSTELSLVDMTAQNGQWHLDLEAHLRGVPNDVEWMSGRAVFEVRCADGSALVLPEMVLRPGDNMDARAVASVLGVPEVSEDPETKAYDHSAMLARIAAWNARMAKEGHPSSAISIGGVAKDPEYKGLLVVTAETARRLGTPGTLARVHLSFSFSRPQVLFEMPIEEGQHRGKGGLSLRVLKAAVVRTKGSGTPINPWMAAVLTVDRPTFANLELFDVERRAPGGVSVIGRNGSLTFIDSTTFFEPIDMLQISIPEPLVWRTDHWVGMPDWMQKTTLAAVRFEPVGLVKRDVDVRSVRMSRLASGGPDAEP